MLSDRPKKENSHYITMFNASYTVIAIIFLYSS